MFSQRGLTFGDLIHEVEVRSIGPFPAAPGSAAKKVAGLCVGAEFLQVGYVNLSPDRAPGAWERLTDRYLTEDWIRDKFLAAGRGGQSVAVQFGEGKPDVVRKFNAKVRELRRGERDREGEIRWRGKRMAITAETALRDCGAVLNYIANTLLKPGPPAENGADDGGDSGDPGGTGLVGAGEGPGTEPAGGEGRERPGENTAGD